MLFPTTVERIYMSDDEESITVLYNHNETDKHMLTLPTEDVLEIIDVLGRKLGIKKGMEGRRHQW